MNKRIISIFNQSFLLITIIFLISCSNQQDNDAAFKALNESLTTANSAILRATYQISISIENKKNDPVIAQSAGKWYPRALKVINLSDTMYKSIEQLKTNVEREKILTDDKTTDIYRKLLAYKDGLMAIDSSMTPGFINTIILTSSAFDTSHKEDKNFRNAFFRGLSTQGIISMLSKFENDIMIIENRIVNYCNNKIPISGDDFNFYSAIIGQSTNYTKGGKPIQITAGVGAFSVKTQPIILIAGKNVPLSEDGAAHYTFKASIISGKHHLPVVINFTDENGKKETISQSVEYTVKE